MDTRYEGEKFLNRLYKDLHMREEVMHTALPSDSKDEKVYKYLERLEKVENMARDSEYNGMKHLKNLYYRKYVIKPDNVPESYFELQKKIALERGQGYVEITEKTRKEMVDTIVEEQKKSLDVWLDYLMSNDAIYPEWFKYYVFQNVVKLGSYDKEKGVFNKRTGSTTNIFIDLNHEALALTYDNLCKFLEGNSLDDVSLQKLIENGSFAKIYGYLIKKLDSQDKELLDSNDGIWIKYDRGSKPDELVKSLQGKGTGWCTAGYETAKKQLQDGDFHVYYTKDKEGNCSQPRIAIRMEGSKIGEIRGIAEKQNLESEMENVLSEKLEEFPDREQYMKKVHDMELLTKLYKEHKDRQLTKDELRFLYEIDNKIVGFGYQEDPRIKEILYERDFKKDLSLVFECLEEQVSDSMVDMLYKPIVCFVGDFIADNDKLDGRFFKLPKIVVGKVRLSRAVSAKNIVFPEIVTGGSIDLSSLKLAENVKFTQNLSHTLDLSSLEYASNVILPQNCDTLYMHRMENVDGFVVPIGFNYDWVSANYITEEDLKNKSLEQQVEESHKRMGFSNIYILALFTYVSSLILTLIGFLILK